MLSEYRKEIDEIDEKIKDLFMRRMEIVLKVKEYKLVNNIDVLDKGREEEILKRLLSNYSDDTTIDYYEKLIKYMFTLSKDFQNE